MVECSESACSAIGGQDAKITVVQPSSNGLTDMQMVTHHQYLAHSGRSFRSFRALRGRALIVLRFSNANQRTNLISAANMTACLPSNVYSARGTPPPLAQLNR